MKKLIAFIAYFVLVNPLWAQQGVPLNNVPIGNGNASIGWKTLPLNGPSVATGVASSDGTLTNGHCVSINSTGNFVDAGGTCTTSGGGGTVSSGTANQVAYYSSSGSAVVGTSLTGEGGIFDTVCSSTIGQMWVRLSSGWGCTSLGYANPVWWGADPTGTNDSTAAFNDAIAASFDIRFPPGTFKFLSQINYTITVQNQGIRLRGSGKDVTVLEWPSTNGIVLTEDYQSDTFTIRDMTIATGSAGLYTGLEVTGAQYVLPLNALITSSVEDVNFRGADGYLATDYWAVGMFINGITGVDIIASNFTGTGDKTACCANGVGLELSGNQAVSGCMFITNIVATNFTLLHEGIEGVTCYQGTTVNQCNFTGVDYGIYQGTGGNSISLLSVDSSQFGNLNFSAIYLASVVQNLQLENNEFWAGSGGSGAVNLVQDGGGIISGNSFWIYSGNSMPGINVGTTFNNQPLVITGNQFVSSFNVGVNLQSTSSYVNVQSNGYAVGLTPVSNAGTNNTVGGGSP